MDNIVQSIKILPKDSLLPRNNFPNLDSRYDLLDTADKRLKQHVNRHPFCKLKELNNALLSYKNEKLRLESRQLKAQPVNSSQLRWNLGGKPTEPLQNLVALGQTAESIEMSELNRKERRLLSQLKAEIAYKLKLNSLKDEMYTRLEVG